MDAILSALFEGVVFLGIYGSITLLVTIAWACILDAYRSINNK